MWFTAYKWAMGRAVTAYWPIVLSLWLSLAVLLWWIAPRWDSITSDGDLGFLPPTSPSRVGQQAVEHAFPALASRSQLAVIFASQSTAQMAAEDLVIALEATRRLHWISGANAWERLAETAILDAQGGSEGSQDAYLLESARDNLTQVIEIEEELAEYYAELSPDFEFRRLPRTFEMRAKLLNALGEADAAADDFDMAALIKEQRVAELKISMPEWAIHLRDVWTWRNKLIGHKLVSADKQARLILLQLETDFTATSNIAVVSGIEQLIDASQSVGKPSEDLEIEISGSAAIGADMLRASAGGVRLTEGVTIVLVIAVLVFIYRAPLLVMLPLLSIVLSLHIASSMVALCARSPEDPSSVGLGVFTTTRIFVVVILFGVGTDFCLFFIARCREFFDKGKTKKRTQFLRGVANAWGSAHNALVGSAMTTIVGLLMMWFSQFEKFQFSGPIIAISLLVTLLVCLTFTPALLCAMGRVAFWPMKLEQKQAESSPKISTYWETLSSTIVAYPVVALLGGIAALLVPAIYGIFLLHSVTYDLTEELSASAPSRRGQRLIEKHFSGLSSSPVAILIEREEPFETEEELRSACNELSNLLYIDRVESVRCLTDPLGDYPPGKPMGLFDSDAWRRRMLKEHRLTRERYISTVENLGERIAKFDIQLEDSAFALTSSSTLTQLRKILDKQLSLQNNGPWKGASFSMAGTAVGIQDLRRVTQADQTTIQVLVVLGVWCVLVVLLRNTILSLYLIGTVLLSYFATLGITQLLFSLQFQDYGGIDWKVPVFLFVILVAVGQDYNIYLVTRISEERTRAGLIEGVKRALVQTGGIITACGVVMACTFISMTAPQILQWFEGLTGFELLDSNLPVLRGLTELGFALSLGVLIDTFVVRTILVPSFVIWWDSRKSAT